jgi:hypothetical protein
MASVTTSRIRLQESNKVRTFSYYLDTKNALAIDIIPMGTAPFFSDYNCFNQENFPEKQQLVLTNSQFPRLTV